jgi:hypothetical protein
VRRAEIRWDLAESVIEYARGVPELISVGVPDAVKDTAAAN